MILCLLNCAAFCNPDFIRLLTLDCHRVTFSAKIHFGYKTLFCPFILANIYPAFVIIQAHEMGNARDKPQEPAVVEDDSTESVYEQLFTAVVNASDGNRSISEAFKVLPSRSV